MNILLMGLRGCGKTTAGKLLAQRLGRTFVDLDDVTPRELGEDTVADAWEKHGEIEFRRAEIEALTGVLARKHQVVALGGGTPTAPGAPTLLEQWSAAGCIAIIYLHTPASVLRERLRRADNRDRPTLTGMGVVEEVDAILAQRDPIYRELARHVVETGTLSPQETAEAIARIIAGPGAGTLSPPGA